MWRLSTPSLISRTPLASACPSPAGNGLWSWRSDITRLWWRTAPIASSPLTARSCRPYGRVIYSGSTSKTIAPGLRVGWLIADEGSIQKLVYLKMRDDLQVNNMAQRQVFHYFRDCGFDDHLRQVIQVYRQRRDTMIHAVKESFPEGTRVIVPGGGLFLWVELPEELDTLEMFDFVFQKNIAYVPGTFFCPDGGGKNTMRLNFSTTSEEKIAEYIPILGEMICQFCHQ